MRGWCSAGGSRGRKRGGGTTMRDVRRIAAVLPLLLTLAGCGVAAAEIPTLASPGQTIVCLGDSITSGVGATPETAYPSLLTSRLGTDVINHGAPGDTAAEVRSAQG